MKIATYRPLVGPLVLPAFFMSVMLGIAQPVLPLYIQEIGGNFAVIGTVISARGLGGLLATLPAGSVLSRLSVRVSMAIGGGLGTAALLLLYSSHSIGWIFTSWLLAGISFALFEFARHQFIAHFIDNTFRGRAVALVGGLLRLGSVLGPALGGWVAQNISFNFPFLLMAGCALAATLIASFTAPHVQPSQAYPRAAGGYRRDLLETLRLYWSRLLVAGGGQLLMQLVRESRSTLIPLLAANQIGLDVAAVGLVLSAGAALDTAMFFPAGLIMDRYGRKLAIVPSLLLQSAGFLLLPFTTTFGGILAVVGMMGFANGLSSGTMLTLGADLAPPGRQISFLGLWRLTSAFGIVLGPNVVGNLAQLLALNPASAAIGLIGLGAAALFWRGVPETLQRSR